MVQEGKNKCVYSSSIVKCQATLLYLMSLIISLNLCHLLFSLEVSKVLFILNHLFRMPCIFQTNDIWNNLSFLLSRLLACIPNVLYLRIFGKFCSTLMCVVRAHVCYQHSINKSDYIRWL